MEEAFKYMILGWFLAMAGQLVTMMAIVSFIRAYGKELFEDEGDE